ncbi:uncharacterized protein LOC110855088 [Folsomia candida]|nr:uncharacterized protein LOC110855088 [Folsomia candida]
MNKDTALHMDATSSLTTTLHQPYTGSRQLYYAIVVTLPDVKDISCIPIAEFVSNRHTVDEIASFLHFYFKKYAEYTGTQKIHFGIRRAETDASLALISGILSALEIGPLNVYLRDCWENLTTSRAMIFVHYICRRHAIQFLKAKVIEHYGRTSEGSKFFIKWLHAFVICSDLWSMSAKMVSALIVCGTRANVALVQSTINSVSNPTSRTGLEPWKILKLENVPKTPPFYLMSPFGYFAVLLGHTNNVDIPKYVLDKIPEIDSDNSSLNEEETSPTNPHYNQKFLMYLLRDVFPLAPMMTHMLLYLNNLPIVQDTNAYSESWFNKMKSRF